MLYPLTVFLPIDRMLKTAVQSVYDLFNRNIVCCNNCTAAFYYSCAFAAQSFRYGYKNRARKQGRTFTYDTGFFVGIRDAS